MALHPDDPRWTAYVLGELDEAARASLESEMESSEAARTLVEELRAAADLTRAELRREAAVAPLSIQQRNRIIAAARRPRPKAWWLAASAAAAAVIVVATFVPQYLRREGLRPAPPAIAAKISEQQPAEPAAAPAVAASESQSLKQEPAPARSSPAHKTIPDPSNAVEAAALQSAIAAAPAAPTLRDVIGESAQVSGTVADTSAARIPGAAIVATNIDTGSAAQTVTDEKGDYVLNGLQPGRYRLTASLPGFLTWVGDGVELHSNAGTKKDVTLSVAGAAAGGLASVTVAADSIGPVNASISNSARTETAGKVNGRPATAAVPNAGGNSFLSVAQYSSSTFSLNVGNSSYATVRKSLNDKRLPQPEAVRIEQLVNYFKLDYPEPAKDRPIGVSLEAAPTPWNPRNVLVRIAIRAKNTTEDVRPRVDFNPAAVDAWRLIGYDNASAGAAVSGNPPRSPETLPGGHAITVLYEIVPRASAAATVALDSKSPATLLTLRLVYKDPQRKQDQILSSPLFEENQTFDRASADFRFAAAVAWFGMILRDPAHVDRASLSSILTIARNTVRAKGKDNRRQFIELAGRAQALLTAR